MNNIHEMDWAEECWHGHTGMDSYSDYCFAGDDAADPATRLPEPQAVQGKGDVRQEGAGGQQDGSGS